MKKQQILLKIHAQTELDYCKKEQQLQPNQHKFCYVSFVDSRFGSIFIPLETYYLAVWEHVKIFIEVLVKRSDSSKFFFANVWRDHCLHQVFLYTAALLYPKSFWKFHTPDDSLFRLQLYFEVKWLFYYTANNYYWGGMTGDRGCGLERNFRLYKAISDVYIRSWRNRYFRIDKRRIKYP